MEVKRENQEKRGIFKRISNAFDHLESRVRHVLSKHPTIYALIGGFSIVLFWRGVWEFADQFSFMTPLASMIISALVMLVTGTFVSFFIGEQIIISGLKEEKRVDQKTEVDLKREEWHVQRLVRQIEEMRTDISEIKKNLNRVLRVKKEEDKSKP